jgi:hypothetical protein
MYAILTMLVALGVSGCGNVQQCPAAIGRRIPYSEESRPEHMSQLTLRAYRDGRLLWFGKIITLPQLRTHLRRSRRFNPPPYLVLMYEGGIDCGRLTELRRAFDEDGGCRDGMICSEYQMPG